MSELTRYQELEMQTAVQAIYAGMALCDKHGIDPHDVINTMRRFEAYKAAQANGETIDLATWLEQQRS